LYDKLQDREQVLSLMIKSLQEREKPSFFCDLKETSYMQVDIPMQERKRIITK